MLRATATLYIAADRVFFLIDHTEQQVFQLDLTSSVDISRMLGADLADLASNVHTPLSAKVRSGAAMIPLRGAVGSTRQTTQAGEES